jgi:hypothetical protein
MVQLGQQLSPCSAVGCPTKQQPEKYGHAMMMMFDDDDVSIPADRNVVRKEAEKKLKYKSLCIEIKRMWNLKCMIIPVIIGATGVVTRSLMKNLEDVPGKHLIDS